MVAVMQSVKAFIDQSVAYRSCLEQKLVALGENVDPKVRQSMAGLYQESSSMEELVADMFNTQLRLYKSANQ